MQSRGNILFQLSAHKQATAKTVVSCETADELRNRVEDELYGNTKESSKCRPEEARLRSL